MQIVRNLIFLSCIWSNIILADEHGIVVSSYHEELENKRGMIKALKDNLPEFIIPQTIYMDTKRLSKDLFEEQATSAKQQIKRVNPGYIFLCDDNAVKLLGEELLEQNYKVVFLGVNNNPRDYLSEKAMNKVYGVLEKPLYQRGLFELRKFYISNDITILFDDTVTSKVVIADIFNKQKTLKLDNLSINYKVINTVQELDDTILSLETNKVQLILGPLHSVNDVATGETYNLDKTLNIIKQKYPYQFFGFWKHYVGSNAAVGAFGVDIIEQGIQAAQLTKLIASNSDTGSHIKIPKTGVYFFSRARLQELGIKLDKDIFQNTRLVD